MRRANTIGFLVGLLLAAWHLFWVLLVAIGWAQPVLDFIFWAHMIQPVYMVRAFDLKASLTLVALSFFAGYIIGITGASAWKKLQTL